MSAFASAFAIHMEQVEGYQFRIRFDKAHHPDLIMDEPAPLGKDAAPNASRVLAAAVGKCLCASLLFCAGRQGVPMEGVSADVRVEIVRNENKRLRIGKIEVVINPQVPEAARDKAKACLELFEDFCIVTQSVRQGIRVDVQVNGL